MRNPGDERLRRLERESDDPDALYRLRVERARRGEPQPFQVGDVVLVHEQESPWIASPQPWQGVVMSLRREDWGTTAYVRPIQKVVWKVNIGFDNLRRGIFQSTEDRKHVQILIPCPPGMTPEQAVRAAQKRGAYVPRGRRPPRANPGSPDDRLQGARRAFRADPSDLRARRALAHEQARRRGFPLTRGLLRGTLRTARQLVRSERDRELLETPLGQELVDTLHQWVAPSDLAEVARLMQGHAWDHEAEDRMQRINVLLEGHGIEAIRDPRRQVDRFWYDCVATYVNMGDSYAPTVVYDTEHGTFSVSDWGSWVEAYENEHGRTECYICGSNDVPEEPGADRCNKCVREGRES